MALAGHDSFMGQYHQALSDEIKIFSRSWRQTAPISTLFFGGGTPSTYPDELLSELFVTLRQSFIFEEKSEITIEVNPGTVRLPDQLILWKSLGINRLSIGVQSLKDDVLKSLNRNQRAADVLTLIEVAKDLFDNISIDLILGLPGVSSDEWKTLLDTVVTFPLKHISIYFLTVHEDTPLYFKVKKEQIILPPDEDMVELYHWSCAFLIAHGFEQYEMSNFARPGFSCKHNQAYWEHVPYKGFGLGACSFDGQARFENDKRLLPYIEHASLGSITTYSELLTERQLFTERLMLGLRCAKGLSLKSVGNLLDNNEDFEKFCAKISILKQESLLYETNGHLMLTARGLVVENQIIIRLL